MYHSSVVFERYDTRDTDRGGLPIELQRGIIDERESPSERKKGATGIFFGREMAGWWWPGI